jgi:TPR repeat protein
MSVDSSARLKEESATLALIGGRRPRARVAIGVLAALVYFAILAFAGVFISGAVNSMSDRGAVARAVVQQIAGDTHGSTSDAQSPPRAAAQAESRHAAVDPVSPHVAPAPQQPAKPESPRAAVAAPALPRAKAATTMALAAPRASVAATTAKQTSRTTVAALTPATEPLHVGAIAPAAPAPKPSAIPTPTAPKAVPQQSDTALVRAFVQSGDARLASGDIASARLYYERAAEAGDARAARLLANSYDPAFLERWGVLGMTGNAQQAARWYRLASGLGDLEAARDLASLQKQ